MFKNCLSVVIALSLWMVSFWLQAEACPSAIRPIDARDVSGIVSSADSIEVASLVCENCEDEQFTELAFQSLKNEKLWKIEGYIIDLPLNDLSENPNFFNPWQLWEMPQVGCVMVPAVRPEGLYDVALKNGEVIWVARHNPNLLSRGLEPLTEPEFSSEFLSELAFDIFRNADIYWTCDAPIDGRPSLSDLNFRPYGRPLPEGLVLPYGYCTEMLQTRGIAHLGKNEYLELGWALMGDRLTGYRLDDEDANAEFSRHLIKLLER